MYLTGFPYGVRPMGYAGNGVASLLQRRPNGTDFICDVKGAFPSREGPLRIFGK